MRKAPPVEPTPDTVDLERVGFRGRSGGSGRTRETESLLGSMRSPTVHVVKPGETLYRISRQHGVSVDKVRKWNKLPDDIIEVGQKLIVGQE